MYFYLKNDTKSSKCNIGTILGELNTLRKSKDFKPYIQQLYLQAEILLIKRINNKQTFQNEVVPLIESDLEDLWTKFQTEDKSNLKDTLNLLVACLNAYPAEMKQLLSEKQLKLKTIFAEKNFDYFYEVISQSTESLPNLQPLCTELMQYLANSETDLFKNMWLSLVDHKLYSRKENEKKYLGFKLFLFCLNLLDEKNLSVVFGETLLASDRLVENLVISYVNKLNNLNALSRDLVKDLTEVIRVKEQLFQDMSVGASLAIKAIKYTKNLHDMSDFVTPLVYVLNKRGLVQYFDFLINELTTMQIELLNNEKLDVVLQSKENANESEGEKTVVESNTDEQIRTKEDRYTLKQIWIINQILNLSKNALTFDDEELVKKILSYLAFHSYFNLPATKVDMGSSGAKKSEAHSPILVKNDRVESHLR